MVVMYILINFVDVLLSRFMFESMSVCDLNVIKLYMFILIFEFIENLVFIWVVWVEKKVIFFFFCVLNIFNLSV